MSFLDHFRRKGAVMGSISIRDLPPHRYLMALLAFTKVSDKDSAFPADDPGAPFHKCDYVVSIKAVDEAEVNPVTFKVEKPIGFYYLILRVSVAREIRGKPGLQIQNFPLGDKPVELRSDATVTLNVSVTWPQEYGRLEDLMRGGG